MIRERLGAAVLRAYPRPVRTARGLEMLGTLLDAGDISFGSFARESASLGLAGLRERARETSHITVGRLTAEAFRLAALIWITVSLAGIISADLFAWPHGLQGLGGWLLLLWPILLCSLLGYDRAAGVCGIAWVVSVQTPVALGPYSMLALGSIVPLVGFIVMAISPRRRAHGVRPLAWLIPTAAMSLISQPSVLGLGTLGIAALAAATATGLFVVAVSPRLLLASALVWASIGAMYAGQALWRGTPTSPNALLIAAPLAILAVSACLRIIRHRTT